MLKSYGLIFCGAVLGVLLRITITEILVIDTKIPVVIMSINLLGCFLLGILTKTLELKMLDTVKKEQIRLFLGVGLLGSFTTYSAFALDTAVFITTDDLPRALLYPLISISCGVLLAWSGIWLATKIFTEKNGN